MARDLSFELKEIYTPGPAKSMSSPFWSFDPFVFGINFLFLLSIVFFSFPCFVGVWNRHLQAFVFFGNTIIKKLFPQIDFYSLGASTILGRFFIFISVINLSSLFSYIFSPMAHIMLTLLLSLIIWVSSFGYQVAFFLKNKLIHLTPKGTPMWLIFFIVLIELVRQLIRPITLGVRLAANLTAGHLILTLLASIRAVASFFAQLPLVVLEVVVSLVQPFVFCLLVFLYFIET